jgi:3-hydroxybutyryl-CoA dehydrogenase
VRADSVGIVGCGQMGAGIAQVAAEAGHDVLVHDVAQALLDRGFERIERAWARAVDRDKMTNEAKTRAAANLKGTLQLEGLRECDLVIEAIVEQVDEKQKLFAALDTVCMPETILATNTSAIPVIELAQATRRADRVCGLHFFYPVPVMALVEVVRTSQTSGETVAAALEFAHSIGKEPIAANDSAGFVVNRLLVPFLLDAMRTIEARVATTSDIDKALRLGCGHPMGPLALADFIGLDTLHAIAGILFERLGEPRFAPPALLTRMVRGGNLGKKSGLGFYDYSGREPRVVNPVP